MKTTEDKDPSRKGRQQRKRKKKTVASIQGIHRWMLWTAKMKNWIFKEFAAQKDEGGKLKRQGADSAQGGT